MQSVNYGVCETCRRRTPARHVIKDGKVFISKDCPNCGVTESLVSSDASAWQRKRDIWQYEPQASTQCTLNCKTCRRDHHPQMVFLDVTNRCNMNCPICIANVPGMGFEFHPPLEYFQKVFRALGKMTPRPTVQLFGGEPTVRDDFFEIVALARQCNLRVRVVTNGIRLADPQYCKKICDAKIPVLLAFDGRDPEIYAKLRKNPGAYDKKLKALENLKKYSRRKNVIMCCVARKVNDKHMRDLIDFCHENHRYIEALHLIPLTENWEPGKFETNMATTIEDVEKIIDDAFPHEQVQFVPAGLGYHLKRAATFFNWRGFTFGGAHPNCESMTLLLSDGRRYRPLGHFLTRPVDKIAEELVTRAKKIDQKLLGLDPDRWFPKWRGRLIVLTGLAPLILGAFDLKKILRGNRFLCMLRIAAGLIRGKRMREVLRKHTTMPDALSMLILPFEEYHSIEGERLENCPSGFVYEDVDSGEIKTIPVCAWALYRNDLERKIMAKYAGDRLKLPPEPADIARVSSPQPGLVETTRE